MWAALTAVSILDCPPLRAAGTKVAGRCLARKIGQCGVVHHSAGPDGPRAGIDDRTHDLTAEPAADGSGGLQGFHTTPVISQVSGPVSRVVVVPGQKVKQGEPLMYVASPDYSQLRTNYLKARDAYALAQKTYARAQDLYHHHAIAEQNLEQAESARSQAVADLASAQAALKSDGNHRSGSPGESPPSFEVPVRAPICGEVVEQDIAAGQLLQTGATQMLHDFRHQYRLGAGERVSERLAVRACGRSSDRSRPTLTRRFFTGKSPTSRRPWTQHAHTAGANRNQIPGGN